MTQQAARSRRKTLSDKQVRDLRPKGSRYTVSDPEQSGLVVRVMPSGAKSFCVISRDAYHRQVWTTLGAVDVLSIAEAREQTRTIIKRLLAGKPAVEPPSQSFGEVAADWVERHCVKNGVRTRGEIERCLRRYILPRLGDREFVSVGRADISKLLDAVEDAHGSRQADACLTICRSIGHWFSSRDDAYRSPIVRGMGRHGNKARTRVLADNELQLIWRAAEQGGAFGGFVRIALLTAQRRRKIASMRWDHVVGGTWRIATEHAREKGTGGELPLPPVAVDVINAMPRVSALVFDGCKSWSHAKRAFDEACGVSNWCLHDLRRSSRSLLARAGVPSHVAERVLGHTLRGVEQIYDRFDYVDAKRDALARLAALISSIVTPPSGNVVAMRRKRRARADA